MIFIIVMQDQEIIRFKLKDYFGESFAYFDHEMLDRTFDPPFVIVDPRLMTITSPYSLFASGNYNLKEFTNPLKDSTTILKMYEKNSFERTYLLYVNEAYQIKIINMTFYELNMDKEIYSLDLIPIINRDISIPKWDKLDSDCVSSNQLIQSILRYFYN